MNSTIAIDIVILPPPNIMDELIGLIKYTESSPIVLNKTNCLPHISLAMGIVNGNDLGKLAASIAETVASANAFEIIISHTEEVKIETGQVFGSAIVVNNAKLTGLHLEMSKKLVPFMSPKKPRKDMFVATPEIPDINISWAEKFGDANLRETFNPHVTLGEGTVSQLPKPITFTAKQIALCQLGNYFTCRKALKKFEICLTGKDEILNKCYNSTMKNAILMPGRPDKDQHYDPSWPSNSENYWFSWLKRQLILQDIHAVSVEPPFPFRPRYNEWKREFERFDITFETILVGHSNGGGFLVRYLSENNQLKVGKVALVAPWINPYNYEESDTADFFDFDIDPNFPARTAGVSMFISSDDDPSVVKTAELLKANVIGLDLHEYTDKGHFCTDDLGTVEFPELLSVVTK